ncbi:SGNH/GDSL hydrolase family protein [Dyadobacter fanqingshengii]|uniref:GDSL-type esterase/lipase family protein n=1 Tax=Dyadobacter fanqingshengii TaxID=2906443 RepID=A0A9X1TJ49_9BACT|nr:GDSL-type esterase/lipase family protein [Dyadobacter fanqingshengii]MCF0043627.1 GDSL-type esterase/lipase family protein [Dyadobacter fanqingshengii]USJ34757.1 GDSL-type esterase/lipase family protein [Dyadobacter fanqingshengii]
MDQPYLKVNSRIVIFGDSLIAQTTGSATNYTAFQSTAFATYALLRINNSLFLPTNGNKGISGNTTTQMLARLGAAVSLNPALVIMDGGTNDAAGGASAATIISNLTYIHNAFKAIGAYVIIITIPPRFAPAALSPAAEIVRNTVNTFIKTLTSETTKAVNLDLVVNNAAFYADGLHFNPTGAYAASTPVTEALLDFIRPTNLADSFFADNSFTANPIMAGSTGTKNIATGTVATSWLLDASSAGGATVVGSKTMDNGLNQQVITISGSYTGNSKSVVLSQEFNTNGLAAGDVVEAFADIEILTTDSNILDFNMGVLVWTSGYVNLANAESILALDQIPSPLPAGGRYTFRTPPITIAAGVPAIVRQAVKVDLVDRASAIPIAASFKVHRIGVRKAV